MENFKENCEKCDSVETPGDFRKGDFSLIERGRTGSIIHGIIFGYQVEGNLIISSINVVVLIVYLGTTGESSNFSIRREF